MNTLEELENFQTELNTLLDEFEYEFDHFDTLYNPYEHYLTVTLKYEKLLWSMAQRAICFDGYWITEACNKVTKAVHEIHDKLKKHL